MAITQQQVSDWFKLNPNATPEQVAQIVQSIGGLAANPGLADLIGKQYGMSGLNIASLYGNLTGQLGTPAPTVFNNAPNQPVTSIEQIQSNAASFNALEDYVRKNKPTEGDIINFAQQQRINPDIAKTFARQYGLATSSQVRDAFTNPTTKTADIVLKLQQEGVSPEAVARYTGITPERASQIYTETLKAKPAVNAPDYGAVIPVGLMQPPPTKVATDTAAVKQVATDTKQVATVANTRENIDKLQSQILSQNTTAEWSGGLPTDKTALYMAADLDKSGITDISQVGKSDKGIINKLTGEKLYSGYGERTKGNLWSGSYEGDGNTGFGVQFTDSGKPIFYSQGASSSTLKKDLIKAAIVAGAVMGFVGPESLAGIFGAEAAALTATEAANLGLTAAETAALGFTATELAAAGYTAAEIATATTAASTATTGLLSNTAATTAATAATAANAATAAATGLTVAQVTDLVKSGLTAAQISQLFSSGATTAAGLLQQQTSKEAADKARAMIEAETAAGKTAAQFKPIGMTTRFGTSEFQFDPKTGQLTNAGYKLSPEAKNAQDRFITLAGQGLTQAEGAQAQFAPLQTGAQSLFGLGNQYLAKSPQEVAQNYLNQQMALLQPGRELELANLQNKLQQQGRGGLAVAQGGTLGDTTPELQALFNARAQQEALLAANAQKAGQADVTFGAGLLTQGAKTMGDYYAGQQAAYAPYTTALTQATGLEAIGQQPFTLSTGLAEKTAAAGSRVADIGSRGAGQSVALATGNAATTNPYSTLLSGVAANPAFANLIGSTFGTTPATTAMSAPATTFGAGNYYGNQDLGLFL